MFGDGALIFREFATREPLPLARVHDAVLESLRGRDDAVLYGVHAVNAYVDESRMTDDVDIASTAPAALAEEVAGFLRQRFAIQTSITSVKAKTRIVGYRVDQERHPTARHLVDVRVESKLPPARRIKGVLVLEPCELICEKLILSLRKTRTADEALHMADLKRLLLRFPRLKRAQGNVRDRLCEMIKTGKPRALLAAWEKLAAETISSDDDESKFE